MERSYSRYLLVVLCVAIIVTATILVALNAYTGTNRMGGLSSITSAITGEGDTIEGYRAGFAAAKQRYEQYGLNAFSGQTNVVIGSVEGTGGQSIVVKQENLMTDQIVSGVPDDRIVLIGSDTVIVRETAKPEAQLIAEQQAFANLPAGTATEPPYPAVRTVVGFADIKTGDRVRVMTLEADVTQVEEVSATEIIILP